MSTPIIEQIAENIETAINAITTANGYNQDLVAVRPRRVDFSDIMPEDLKVLIVQADEEKIEGAAVGTAEWMQPFILMALVIDSDSAAASIDTRINNVRADIQKKLLEDAHRSNLAIDTIPLASNKFDDGEGFTGIAVAVVVHYRTKIDDPYTQI